MSLLRREALGLHQPELGARDETAEEDDRSRVGMITEGSRRDNRYSSFIFFFHILSLLTF